MNEHLQKQMTELAEEQANRLENQNIGIPRNILNAGIYCGFIKGFQAAVPLVRAECEEEQEKLLALIRMMGTEIGALKSKSAKLLEALKFYADIENWALVPGKPNFYPLILNDYRNENMELIGGNKAHQALQQYEASK